ncbi:MAG: peptide chain release factor N(5)-glutamine methyltransferase [Desulfotalea sp.]
MRVSQLIKKAKDSLFELGVESAAVEVELLLGHCLGKSRTELYLAASEELSPKEYEHWLDLFARRLTREPLAYILGEQEFWSLHFYVSPDVLIPRPETEFMLELVLASQGQWRQGGPIIDLCTGSGVIAVVLAKELGRPIIAIDISEKALNVAQKNIDYHHLTQQVNCLQSDLFGNYPVEQKISLLVSNPPYVKKSSIDFEVEPEVREFEPHLALDGGDDDGLAFIRRIWQKSFNLLANNAEIFIEFGSEQGEIVRKIFSTPYADGSHFTNIKIIKDYSRRDRVINATYKPTIKEYKI